MSLDRGMYASILLSTHTVPTFWMRCKSNNPSQVPQRCRLTICNGIQMSRTCCNSGVKASHLIMPMTLLVLMFCILSFTMHTQYVLMPRMNLSNHFSLIFVCMKMIFMIYMKNEMTIVKLRQKARNYGINVQEYLVAQWVEYSNCAQKYVMSLDICKHAYILICTHTVPKFWMRRKSNNPSQVPQRCRLTKCNGIQMSRTCSSTSVKASYWIFSMTFLVFMVCMLSFTMHIQHGNNFEFDTFSMKAIYMMNMTIEMAIVKLRQKARNYGITVHENLVAQGVEHCICAQKYVMSLDRCKYASILLCTHIVPTFWMRSKSNNPSQEPQRCRLTKCNGIQTFRTCCNRNVKDSHLIMPMTFLVFMFCMLSFTMHTQHGSMPKMNSFNFFGLIVYSMKMIT